MKRGLKGPALSIAVGSFSNRDGSGSNEASPNSHSSSNPHTPVILSESVARRLEIKPAAPAHCYPAFL